MRHSIIGEGISRSFPAADKFVSSASLNAVILVIIGADAGTSYNAVPNKESYRAILIELGTECLGVHTGEQKGEEGSNTLGFARFRLGDTPPSQLVEIVRQPATSAGALEAAQQLFQSHGLITAVCADFPGRIVDRLIRPYYNAALHRLDTKLASASDMDLTIKLGLGYPEGPIELLERTGLAAHFDVTAALHAALGEPAYAPARRAQVAKARSLSR